MTKLRKTLMAAGVLLLSSVAFVGCSDDKEFPDNTLGATYVIAITASTNQVDLHWNISPTSNVEGYLIQIYQGTYGNLGSLVTEQKFGNKEYQSVFTGLQPNTHYVVASQAIPAAGSKFTKADVAYYEFWTAPVMTITSATATVTEMVDEDGNTIYQTDEDGNETTEPAYQAALTINWAESLDKQQIAGVYITMETTDTVTNDDGEEEEKTTVVIDNELIPASNTTTNSASIIAENVTPGKEYTLSVFPNPSQYSFYKTPNVEWSDDYPFTMPAAQ